MSHPHLKILRKLLIRGYDYTERLKIFQVVIANCLLVFSQGNVQPSEQTKTSPLESKKSAPSLPPRPHPTVLRRLSSKRQDQP